MSEELISVCIITYNSSATVVETLESIKSQTYKNVELIVSDDGSKDDTVSVVEKWISENKSRFVNSQVVTVEKNTGVALNLIRSIEKSTGKWIKILAGDDKLRSDCLEVFYGYTQKSQCQFYSCDLELFCEDGEVSPKVYNNYRFFWKETCKSLKAKQKHILSYFDYPGPAWFFSRQLYDAVGGIDKNYSMMDEYPFMFKLLQAGYDICPVPEKVVLYRVGSASLSHNKSPLGLEIMHVQNKQFFYDFRIKALKKRGMIFHIIDQWLYYLTMDNQFAYYKKYGKKSKFLSIPYRINIVYIFRKLSLLMVSKFSRKF